VGEEYTGPKFHSEVTGDLSEALFPQVDEYLAVDKKLKNYLSPKNNEGNLSMRTFGGFLIKGAGAHMTKLKPEEVSFVYSVDEEKYAAKAKGATPSSESFLHHYIYKEYPEINLVLHFHDDYLMEKARHLPTIGPYPYGSHDLARDAAKAKASVIRVIEHGFVVKARTPEELFNTLTALRSI